MTRAPIARHLGAADIYLCILAVVLGIALAFVAHTLNETSAARRAFRRELADLGAMLEDADEQLRDAGLRARASDMAEGRSL